MTKTKIEWCDFTLNPIKGLCPMDCKNLAGKPYCYARRMYKRFKWDDKISYKSIDWMNREIDRIDNRRGQVGENARIFIGSTMELFGNWVADNYLLNLFKLLQGWPEHTFIFLTKQPQNLHKFSPFPDNCHIGISCDTKQRMIDGYKYLCNIDAKVKFISFEPLLERMDVKSLASINWVIIGEQTPHNQRTAPKIEWVRELVMATDQSKTPVFLKGNLELTLRHSNLPLTDSQLFLRQGQFRQEFPNV